MYEAKEHMTVKKLLVTKLRVKISCYGCHTMKYYVIHNTGHFMRDSLFAGKRTSLL